MAQIVLGRLLRKFGDDIVETHAQAGNETAVVAPGRLLEIAEFLRDDRELRFNLPIDCTAVDWYKKREPRFEVVWHFYSIPRKHRIRIKVRVGEAEPAVPSLTGVWPGLNFFEREAWDLYGVHFTGHPNLKRILMYEEFDGHPLRKDYPIDKRQPLIPMRGVRAIPTQLHPPPEVLNSP